MENSWKSPFSCTILSAKFFILALILGVFKIEKFVRDLVLPFAIVKTLKTFHFEEKFRTCPQFFDYKCPLMVITY